MRNGSILRASAAATLMAFALATSCLSAQAQNVLVYDQSVNNNNAENGILSLGITPTLATSSNFNTLLTGGVWDLVVVDAPSTVPTTASGKWTPLIAYIAGGGKAMMSFWDLDNDSGNGDPLLAAAFEVSVNTSINTPASVFRWNAGHPIFNNPNVTGDITSFSDTWADDGDRLNVLGSATGLAGFTAGVTGGQAAIVLGNGGRTLYNGFLWDEMGTTQGPNLVANEARFLLDGAAVPEPGSLAMLGGLGLSAVGVVIRRRRSA
jgi:hypothetical protein